MSRIAEVFQKLQNKGHKAFIPYLAAGVPGDNETVELVLTLDKAGADIVELGFPFSDPMADGPVNQQAANRALELGVNAERYFNMVREIRKRSSIPLVVFSYLNPIFRVGYSAFARMAAEAGMDGMLLVDLPVEESDEFLDACRAHSLDPIFLIAPTTTLSRLARIREVSSGFLYYISRTGVTGEQQDFQESFEQKLGKVHAGSGLPVVVGFGISTPLHVETASRLSDGVVVGSAIVRRTLAERPFEEIRNDVLSYVTPLIEVTKRNGSK